MQYVRSMTLFLALSGTLIGSLAEAAESGFDTNQRIHIYESVLAKHGYLINNVERESSIGVSTILYPLTSTVAYFFAPKGWYQNSPERISFVTDKTERVVCDWALITVQAAGSKPTVQIGNCTGAAGFQKLTTEQKIGNVLRMDGPSIDILIDEAVDTSND
ncbi:MAG: hypothetical protein AB7K68_16245 [Bacteriovoracia bacterium]